MGVVTTVSIGLALVVAASRVWRWASWPCPAWRVPRLDNPYFEKVGAPRTTES